MNAWKGVPPCPHERHWMTGAKECIACWMLRQGWDETTASYPESERLPFSEPVHDPLWDDASEAITSDAAPVRQAG